MDRIDTYISKSSTKSIPYRPPTTCTPHVDHESIRCDLWTSHSPSSKRRNRMGCTHQWPLAVGGRYMVRTTRLPPRRALDGGISILPRPRPAQQRQSPPVRDPHSSVLVSFTCHSQAAVSRMNATFLIILVSITSSSAPLSSINKTDRKGPKQPWWYHDGYGEPCQNERLQASSISARGKDNPLQRMQNPNRATTGYQWGINNRSSPAKSAVSPSQCPRSTSPSHQSRRPHPIWG